MEDPAQPAKAPAGDGAPSPVRDLSGWIPAVLLLQHLAGIGAFWWMVVQNRRADAHSGYTLLSDWQRDQEFGLIGLINLGSALAIAAAAGSLVLSLLPADRRWGRVLLRFLGIAVLQAVWLPVGIELTLAGFERFFAPVPS